MKWSKKASCIYIANILLTGVLLVGCGKEKVVETELFHEEEICSFSQLQAELGMDNGDVLA